jgi:hypothetical protein
MRPDRQNGSRVRQRRDLAAGLTDLPGRRESLANQYAGHDLGFINPALYRIARSPWYRTAFHDITRGSNTAKFPPKTFTGYQARPGWDPVTGWGSPSARVLIPLLARYASP